MGFLPTYKTKSQIQIPDLRSRGTETTASRGPARARRGSSLCSTAALGTAGVTAARGPSSPLQVLVTCRICPTAFSDRQEKNHQGEFSDLSLNRQFYGRFLQFSVALAVAVSSARVHAQMISPGLQHTESSHSRLDLPTLWHCGHNPPHAPRPLSSPGDRHFCRVLPGPAHPSWKQPSNSPPLHPTLSFAYLFLRVSSSSLLHPITGFLEGGCKLLSLTETPMLNPLAVSSSLCWRWGSSAAPKLM